MEFYAILFVAIVVVIALVVILCRLGERASRTIQFASLIRSQLILLLSPIAIVVLSTTIPGVFANLLDLESRLEAFLVSFLGFSSAWFCLAMTIAALDHAEERFGVKIHAPDWFWEYSAIIFAIPPVILMLAVLIVSPLLPVLIGLISGALAAYLCAVVIDTAVHFLDPPATTPNGRRFIFTLEFYPRALKDFLNQSDPLARVPSGLFQWLKCLGPGYVGPDCLGPNARPYPDQIAVAFSILVAFIVYSISFRWGWCLLAHGRGTTYVPVLAYLEFLILAIFIVISGAAFYLDRYRVPVLTSVLIYSIAVSMLADTDHYWFAAAPKAETPVAAPYSDGVKEWLEKYGKNPAGVLSGHDARPVVVVVCASGGGIEASAWTTRVLKGIYEELGPQLGTAFLRSIRLISSTSGGSVGSLFFTQAYYTERDVPSNQLENIWQASIKRSLDATGWGLVHPDFARLFFPMALKFWLVGDDPRKIDRGWALEQSWRGALDDPKNPAGYIDSQLSDWRKAVAQDLLPGTVFNATLVETGDPLLLSTVRLDMPTDSRSVIFDQNPAPIGDLSMVTAARLSATFPYVSPVAAGRFIGQESQPAEYQPLGGMHVADGGYYDNFGVTVAVEWIKQIHQTYGDNVGKFLVVRIDAFPETAKKSPEKRFELDRFFNPRSGWGSEVLGPVKTVLNARSETQYGRDVIEFDLLNHDGGKSQVGPQPSSNGKTPPECDGSVNVVPFIANTEGPLSWQLSKTDVGNIEKDWNAIRHQQVGLLKQCLSAP